MLLAEPTASFDGPLQTRKCMHEDFCCSHNLSPSRVAMKRSLKKVAVFFGGMAIVELV